MRYVIRMYNFISSFAASIYTIINIQEIYAAQLVNIDTNKNIIWLLQSFLKGHKQNASRIGLYTFYTIYVQLNVNDDMSYLSFTLSMNTHTPSLDQWVSLRH